MSGEWAGSGGEWARSERGVGGRDGHVQGPGMYALTYLHSLYPLQFAVQDGRHVWQLDVGVDGMAE